MKIINLKYIYNFIRHSMTAKKTKTNNNNDLEYN